MGIPGREDGGHDSASDVTTHSLHHHVYLLGEREREREREDRGRGDGWMLQSGCCIWGSGSPPPEVQQQRGGICDTLSGGRAVSCVPASASSWNEGGAAGHEAESIEGIPRRGLIGGIGYC